MDWEQEYRDLMAHARENLNPEWKYGEVIVLKTEPGHIYWAAIPDYQKPDIREPLENELIQTLMDCEDTRVLVCLCTMNGEHPDISSWHLRSRLVEINSENLQTDTFLWGGGDTVFVKPFSSLLPPKKKENQ